MTRLLSLALAAAVLVGCDATSSELFVQDPIPPEAFALNTGGFPDDASATAGANFLDAAARVGVISAAVGDNLSLPVVATRAVIQGAPTVEADGERVWRATSDVLGTPMGLRLQSAPEAGELAWNLATDEDTEEPFTFYTATTTLDGETGAWRLFRQGEPGMVLAATFNVRELRRREITFRVPQGREYGGSRVVYRTVGAEQTFDWTAANGDRALIVWDSQTGAGSITAATYNGGAQACWNASLQDVGC